VSDHRFALPRQCLCQYLRQNSAWQGHHAGDLGQPPSDVYGPCAIAGMFGCAPAMRFAAEPTARARVMLPAQQFVLHHTCLRTHRLATGISIHWEYRSSVLREGVILCLWESDASGSSSGPRWASPGFQARFGVSHDLNAQLRSGNGPKK